MKDYRSDAGTAQWMAIQITDHLKTFKEPLTLNNLDTAAKYSPDGFPVSGDAITLLSR